MAWSTPLTAVANATLTAAQWNASVRDNLNETAPAKATGAAQIFVSTGANAIAARAIVTSYVATTETTTSTTYADLTTVGPSVTATTGTAALVFISSRLWTTATSYVHASFEISGATTSAALDQKSIAERVAAGNDGSVGGRSGVSWMEAGLTPGSNTFRMKYRVTSGTGRFDERHMFVIAL